MKNIAIIPLRGGSFRVPRKNIKPFCGKPLMCWTIEAALNSTLVNEVYVTTDDDEIEAVAREYPAVQIIRRPDWPDADQAAVNRPLLHAIKEIGGGEFRMVTLLATSPQRKQDDINRAIVHHMVTGAQVSAMHRKRETFIYRDKGLGVAEAVLADKYEQHFELASGLVSVQNSNWYQWFVPQIGTDLDADINLMGIDARDMPNNQLYYIEVEAWQVPETDTLEEFELCELIMKRYIL